VWRFGATTDCSIDDLVKWHPRSKPHRYRVLFERALARERPEYRAWAVEVEDLGTDFQPDPVNDLLAWDEVS